MKRTATYASLGLLCAALIGCSTSAPGEGNANQANEAFKAMSPEQQFEMLKLQPLSGPQKAVTIDGLPVDQAQKDKWKAELGVSGITGGN